MLKKIILVIVLPVLMFVSCSKEPEAIVVDNSNSFSHSKTIDGIIGVSEFPYIIKDATVSDDKLQLKSAGVWEGPYYTKGTLAKVYSNLKMTLDGSKVPGVSTGIYFCDVYSYSVKVNLPTNSIAKVDIPNPCGYSNFSTQDIGVNFTQTTTSGGMTLSMGTYTIVIKTNILGQTINLVRPVDGNTITFSYWVMTY